MTSSTHDAFRHIPFFADINSFYEGVGFPQRSSTNRFHIFRVEDTFPHVVQYQPPFRKNFYHLALIFSSPELQFSLNGKNYEGGEALLLCHSPDHIHSWLRVKGMRGFVINFSIDFSSRMNPLLLALFDPTLKNNCIISTATADELLHDFENLYRSYISQAGEGLELEEHYTAILLLRYHRLFNGIEKERKLSASERLYGRFKEMVAKQYLTVRNVQQYAQLLHTSPKYLSEVVMRVSGRRPKDHIDERLLLEIQRILLHTDLSIAEISYRLYFSEPANLSKFFRKHKGLSAQAYRKAESRK